MITAFNQIKTDLKLIIAGKTDHDSEYQKKLYATANDRIIFTGYITGEPLNQLFSHAKLFVLPSYHEGLPIALLEAMSHGLSVLVSDIPANRSIELSKERFFKCGNVNDLKNKIEIFLTAQISNEEKKSLQLLIMDKYNWQRIAEKTIAVYNKIGT